MDCVPVIEIIRSAFDGFKGTSDQLYRELCMRRDFRSLPETPSMRGFLATLKTMVPYAREIGLHIEFFGEIADCAMVRVRAVSTAQKEQDEEARLRVAFNSPAPEGAALRKEFNSFESFYAYKTASNAGRITLRRGKNVIDTAVQSIRAQVDPRLTIEAQCRQRWEIEPETRKAFGNSYDRFEAFERANARGLVRQLAPGA